MSREEAVLKPSDKDNQPVGDFGMEGWEHIRELDEEENWSERTKVLSKGDHMCHIQYAKEFVEEIVEKLPAPQLGAKEEEVSVEPAMSRDSFEYMEQFGDDDFQTSAHQLDVDFLERVSSKPSQPSALARESLYVKFDPLVGGSSPKTSAQKAVPLTVANRIAKNSSDNLLVMDTPPKHIHPDSASDLLTCSPSTFNATTVHHHPKAVSKLVQDSTSLVSPLRDTASALPDSVTDGGGDTGTLVKVLKYSEDDWRRREEAIRLEEREKMEEQLSALREELSKRETTSQRRVEQAQKQFQSARISVSTHVVDKAKLEEQVARWSELVNVHAESMSKATAEYEELKKQTKEVEQQRDQALKEFGSLEKSFDDFHERHRRLKVMSQTLQRNEAVLKQNICDLEEQKTRAEEQYQALQDEVNEKLDQANKKYDEMRKDHTSEVVVLNTSIKKLTMQVASVQKALEQKEQEKEELTHICDDLMKELARR